MTCFPSWNICFDTSAAAPAGSESALSSCMVCAHSSAPWLQAALSRRSTTRIWGLWASAQTGHGIFWDPKILGIQDGQELTSWMGAPPDIGSGAWFSSPCSNDIAECAQGLIDLDRLQMQKKHWPSGITKVFHVSTENSFPHS